MGAVLKLLFLFSICLVISFPHSSPAQNYLVLQAGTLYPFERTPSGFERQNLPGFTFAFTRASLISDKISLYQGVSINQRVTQYLLVEKEQTHRSNLIYLNLPLEINYATSLHTLLGFAIAPGVNLLDAYSVHSDNGQTNSILHAIWKKGGPYHKFDLLISGHFQMNLTKQLITRISFGQGIYPRLIKDARNQATIPKENRYKTNWQILQLSAGWRLNRA